MAYTPAMFHGPVGARTGVSFFINGRPYHADSSNPSFLELLDELRLSNPDSDRLITLSQPARAIINAIAAAEEASADSADYLPRGVVSVTASEIRYNGEQVHGVLVDRILEMLVAGFNIMPMIRFLENLYQNPGEWARDELYLWLEKSNLPITEDGHFLAYKMVKSDFTSLHDGRTDNTPGKIVQMPRSSVDSVRAHLCSTGLHFCSLKYIGSGFGSSGSMVLLKVNPADVVSIPSDYDNSKGRAWRYEVLSKFGEDPYTKVWPSVVSPTGNAIETKLDVGSDLAKSLFAASNKIGLTERYARLKWATDILQTEINSFHNLTVEQAETLLEYAHAHQAELAERNRQNQFDLINSLGIENLRRVASHYGYPGAWKGPKASELKSYLMSKIK